MKKLSWSSKYSIGVREIDSQHKKLVEIINDVIKAINSGNDNKKIMNVLNSLADYTVSHFATEEELMMKYEYPEFNAHKDEHEKLVNEIKIFRNDYIQEKVSLSIDIANYLKDWLINHIMDTDKKLGEFLNKLGIK
jgi:hemerythrin-like metal-binding protein